MSSISFWRVFEKNGFPHYRNDLKPSICVHGFELVGMLVVCVNLKQSECVYGYETEFVYEFKSSSCVYGCISVCV
jgi:hypothetical protein